MTRSYRIRSFIKTEHFCLNIQTLYILLFFTPIIIDAALSITITMAEAVPVVDFSAYSLDRDSPDPADLQQLVDEVHTALTTFGFMCLKNTGVPAQKIKNIFRVAKDFFQLDVDVKERCSVEPCPRGYTHLALSRVNPDRPHDLREAFQYRPGFSPDQPYPDKEVPDFEATITDFFDTITPLNKRLLEVAAIGLKLEDKAYFVNCSHFMGTAENLSNLVLNNYPALNDLQEIESGQIRLGEHTDSGAFTLLFQDSMGGLEVQNVKGEWKPVIPNDDTVIVNIGDMMQRWTSDVLIAGKHRVVIPEEEARRRQSRNSVVFFGVPDKDTVIECVDGSNKYPPVTCHEYELMRLRGASLME